MLDAEPEAARLANLRSLLSAPTPRERDGERDASPEAARDRARDSAHAAAHDSARGDARDPARDAAHNWAPDAARNWARFAELRLARLCRELRKREPDDHVGYSILLYEVDAEELARLDTNALSPGAPR